jgi:hypothetical protein
MVVTIKVSLGTNVGFFLGFNFFWHVEEGVGIGRSSRDEIIYFCFFY